MCGEGCVSAGLGMIPISRDTTYAPLGMTHNNQILCGIKLDKRNIFTESTKALWPWPKMFVTQMLTHDLFAVANFLL